MTPGRIIAVLALAAVVAGCALEEPASSDGVGTTTESIIGGTTAPLDSAVVLVELGGGYCTGTLIRPNVVLTAAHCLPATRVGFGPAYNQITDRRNVIAQFKSRRYNAGLYAGGDIALLLLDSDAPAGIDPVPINDVYTLTQADVGAEIRTVGYGNTDGVAGTGFGTRRQVTHNILGVTDQFIQFGSSSANTCQGDSGGPTFMVIDGVEHVIAVTSFGSTGCRDSSDVTRVNIYADEFLHEVLDAWTGPCKLDGACVTTCPGFPDPDCDPCGFDGTCATGCAKKDLDCPLSGGPGAACGDREDCESLTCITAQDDPRVSYCSQECDPATNDGCQSPITLCASDDQGNYCRYPGSTPTTQGATCMDASDCRSGVCDSRDHICVEPCASTDECADGYTCQKLNGTDVCRIPKGGGICQTGGTPGTLVLIGLAGLLGLLGRRRRRDSQCGG